jgi:chromosome segregation ATPase
MITPAEATFFGALIAAASALVGAVLNHRFKRKEAQPSYDAQLRDQLLAALRQQQEDKDRLQHRFDQADLTIAGWRGRFDDLHATYQKLLLRCDELERRHAEVLDQLNDASGELIQANVELHTAREQMATVMEQMTALQVELGAERVARQALEVLQQVKAANHAEEAGR